MKTLREMEAEKSDVLDKLRAIDKQIAERKSQTIVLCTNNNYGKGCGSGFRVCDLEYIQTHYYTEPHGCSEGDYWSSGEGNFDCPNCGHRNRLYDRPDIEELKHLFKSTVDEHER